MKIDQDKEQSFTLKEYKKIMSSFSNPPPCCLCQERSFRRCAQTGSECVAFKHYVQSGRFKSELIGKHPLPDKVSLSFYKTRYGLKLSEICNLLKMNHVKVKKLHKRGKLKSLIENINPRE